jgi:hypothetical protein
LYLFFAYQSLSKGERPLSEFHTEPSFSQIADKERLQGIGSPGINPTPWPRLDYSNNMKPLIELTTEQYKSLMHQASDAFRSHSTLTNAVETQAGTIAILCDLDEAETFRQMAKQFCPDAVPQIEKAIGLARFPG